jgi:23S rRNA (pseudouridine1915-N3)-methyltransferase
MKISLWSIGKGNDPYVQDGITEFTKRISRYFPVEWNIIAPPKNAGLLSEKDLRAKESALVMAALRTDDFLVALDERGRSLSSEGLAQFIQQRATEGKKNLVFLIGGAYGLDEEIKKRADFLWSLSALTFPHQLVRLILSEQVYRACSILRNEKYHHS